jgi:hypothetical protein
MEARSTLAGSNLSHTIMEKAGLPSDDRIMLRLPRPRP